METSRKIRLGYFLYGKGLGGNGRYVQTLIEHLDLNRFEPVVYLFCPPGRERDSFIGNIKRNGARVVELTEEGLIVSGSTRDVNGIGKTRSHSLLPHSLKLLLYYYNLVQKAKETFRQDKLDIFHFSLGTFPTMLHCVIGALLARIPKVIITVHILQDYPKPRFVEKLMSFFVVRSSVDVIAISKTMKSELITKFGFKSDEINCIYNGVDESDYQLDGNGVRQSIGLSDRDVVALIPARLDQVKGHGVLFRAIEEIKGQLNGAKFVLAGAGPLEEHLQQAARALKIDSSVKFIGFRNDLPKFISASDFVILPSLNEGFPFVLLEAMACGKPIVATDVGAVCEMYEYGYVGELVPAGKPEPLSMAILNVISMQPKEKEEVSKRCRALISGQFSERQMLERTFKHYEFQMQKGLKCD